MFFLSNYGVWCEKPREVLEICYVEKTQKQRLRLVYCLLLKNVCRDLVVFGREQLIGRFEVCHEGNTLGPAVRVSNRVGLWKSNSSGWLDPWCCSQPRCHVFRNLSSSKVSDEATVSV